ncbi:glycosyltransferase [Sinomonas sp. R1AF57]|uniref:glycosyltransferase n=1 Tax=Sinomonas sp. R1AF57 TaxID=2020377 RepID=UPI000B5F3796|nr:glycosyltransferase [Sinomonas sp. R1AF57]ASN52579.1 glycosyl transferase [Sinomonas sp. R1AF57]
MSKSVAIIGTRGYPSYYGGFETAVRRLSPYLAENGWDVVVYGRPGATRPDDPQSDERVRSVITHGVESTSLSTLSFGLTSVLHAMKYRPDVALVMNVANGFWLPLLKLRGIPTVVNVDGIEWERAKWGRVAKRAFRLGALLTAKFATELIADAHAIAERWRREFGRTARFVPYGGDVPAELPIEEGLTHRGYILMVARFVPENTVAEFFRASEALATRHPVVIVGSSGYGGEFDEQAGALAKAHSNVRWLGHLSDDRRLHSLWQHAGAYFHGHSVGGTNPALVQAMACGAPTVARDTVYNREVLGDTGFFVEPTAEAIIEGLDEAMARASSIDTTAIVARAEEHYSWTGVCDGYEKALLDHIGEKDSRTGTPAPNDILTANPHEDLESETSTSSSNGEMEEFEAEFGTTVESNLAVSDEDSQEENVAPARGDRR